MDRQIWTIAQVHNHPRYSLHSYTNPLYAIWKDVASSGLLCRKWRRSYWQFAIDVLNELGEPTDKGVVREMEFSIDGRELLYEPNNIRWGNTMSVQSQYKQACGRKRITDPNQLVHRSASFDKPLADGSYIIGGKRFANQYQYKKYRKYINSRRADGTSWLEGIDFHLTEDGVVVEGSAL